MCENDWIWRIVVKKKKEKIPIMTSGWVKKKGGISEWSVFAEKNLQSHTHTQFLFTSLGPEAYNIMEAIFQRKNVKSQIQN